MDHIPTPSRLVGSRMKALREARRWNQSELTKRLNELGHPYHHSAISRVESGDRGVSVDDLFAFADALDTSPLALLAWEETTLLTVGDREVGGPSYWQWLMMRVPLPGQDLNRFATSTSWAQDELRREEARELERYRARLLRFLKEHSGEMDPYTRGALTALLWQAPDDLRLPDLSDSEDN